MEKSQQKYQVRLRHVQGDLGPFTLPAEATVPELADLACANWPEEGPLSEHRPNSPAEIKFISSGRFVESSQTIGGLAASFGPLSSDSVITLHLIIRPARTSKDGSVKGEGKSSGNRCCGCTII